MLKLKILVENHTYIDHYYLGEPGLSYYIECDDKRILFDTGYSDAYIQNAIKMNIDLNNLDYVIISHGHNDHTGGLKYLIEKYDTSNTTFVSHPDIFDEKHHKGVEIGCPIDLKDIKNSFKEVILTTDVIYITDNLVYLGQIKRTNDYENKKPVGYKVINNTKQDDYCIDDSALVYKGNKLTVISACSHSGICNICDYSKVITGINEIETVIGGFHLFDDDEVLDKTVNYFKQNNIDYLYPCHCVSLICKNKMMNALNVIEVGVGLELERA